MKTVAVLDGLTLALFTGKADDRRRPIA